MFGGIICGRNLYNCNSRVFSQHPTVNEELPNRIISGTLQVKPNISRFDGSRVHFDDGSVVEDVDLVVGCYNWVFLNFVLLMRICHSGESSTLQLFATGYKFSFPFLAADVIPVSQNKASLYKNVFPPELDNPTLAVIGLVQPLGSTLPISEMQARWAVLVFKGNTEICIRSNLGKQCPSPFFCFATGSVNLPPVAAMRNDIDSKKENMAKR